MNPGAPSFIPGKDPVSGKDQMSELARLMAKNQLLPKRLPHFGDEPSRYLSFKFSFVNILEEIKASPLEQLDLLVNHLGQESRSQAENIRASNPNNPDRAVNQIWERLDRQYGSPETIEFALKQRIQNFPNLTEGDRKRYYDLSDLAAEVESVKSDCAFGPAFAYYDTVSGVNEFVRKLPKRLREKWAVECDSFKVKNNMFHAPFMFFAQFLWNLARLKNDPSFVFDNVPVSASQSSSSSHQRPSNKANRFIGVSNKKTEVDDSSKTDSSNTRCPIHGTNSNHTLKDCNKFRDKSLKEKKRLLV